MFRTKLVLVSALFIGLIIVLGGLAQWSAAQFHYHLVRSQLAHNVRAEYLALAGQTYALFKQFMDFAITDEWDANSTEALRLRQDIEANLERIRLLIAREVAHVDEREDESAELNLLAQIERKLQTILARFETVRQLKVNGQHQEAKVRIAEILENSIDQKFKALINQALLDEKQEVDATDQATDAVLRRLSYASNASLAVAILLGFSSLLLLLRRLHGPLHSMMQGTQALAEGKLTYRMPVAGRDEFARIAISFNQMAEELEHHRQQSQQTQESLERLVMERTNQLRAANQALSRSDKTRRQFFADISHELRTPLTVISGEAQFALRGADKTPDDYKDTLHRICDQAAQLSRLVDDLLFIARSDAGANRLDRKAVALDKLVTQVCTDAQILATAKGIKIQFQSDVTEVVINGDQGRLRQLFLILLDNAICYSRPASEIFVILSPSPGGVSVHVSDSGIGIPSDQLEMVFERFYRGGNAMGVHAEGLGLGLPVAKAIVEAHEGSISIDSLLDRGTVVAVTLPTTPKLRVAV